MKNCLLVVLFAVSVLVAADPQFRLATNGAVDFADRPSLADLQTSLDDPANLFYGLQWEVITGGSVGFGMHTLVRYVSLPVPGSIGSLEDWWLDWNGDFFVSYHPFGGGATVDPFLDIGYGCVGRVQLTPGMSGTWYQDDADLWLYEWEDRPYDALTNISLYPFVALGIALDLDGFLIGARAAYRPITHRIPGTQIENYPLKNVQVGFFGGLAFGGRSRRRR